MRKVVVEREYVSVDALKAELQKMMERKDVQSWLQTAFDATDIDALIDGLDEDSYITICIKVDSTAAPCNAEPAHLMKGES